MFLIFLIWLYIMLTTSLKKCIVCCYDDDLITTPEGPTRIDYSTNSETVVFLKVQTCVKNAVQSEGTYEKRYIGYFVVSTMGLFSIIRFNIRFLNFAKFVEFMKRSTVKAGLKIY